MINPQAEANNTKPNIKTGPCAPTKPPMEADPPTNVVSTNQNPPQQLHHVCRQPHPSATQPARSRSVLLVYIPRPTRRSTWSDITPRRLHPVLAVPPTRAVSGLFPPGWRTCNGLHSVSALSPSSPPVPSPDIRTVPTARISFVVSPPHLGNGHTPSRPIRRYANQPSAQ